jgi:hypothetical protein
MRRDFAAVFIALLVLVLVWWLAGFVVYRRFVAAAYIGALVGMGEIIARYRDAPDRALRTMPAGLYILINAFASIVAMYVVWTFNLAPAASGARTLIQQIFLAGFGAMALFRTSVFTVRVADHDIGIGPVAFLQIILGATDRDVDRIRAEARATAISTYMAGVSFTRAQAALPAFCLALMQNVPADEQNAVGTATKALIGSNELDDETKIRNLGLALMNVVGDKILYTAVTHLADTIQRTEKIAVTVPPSLPVGKTVNAEAICEAREGRKLPARKVTWTSDKPAVATISANGQISAITQGETVIRAVSDGVEANAPLTVP